MGQYPENSSSTATNSSFPLTSTCDGCPKLHSPSSSSSAGGINTTDMLFTAIGELNNLKKEIEDLKKHDLQSSSFFQSSTNLNKTVRIVVIILMLVPLIQLILCTAVVYYLGIQEEISGLLNWVLGGVTLLSFVEVFLGGSKLYQLNSRMDATEKKIEKLDKT